MMKKLLFKIVHQYYDLSNLQNSYEPTYEIFSEQIFAY
jgi:hypothetical protein